MSNDPGGTDPVLFHEPGGRWRGLLWGPAFCLVVLAVELASGPVIHWFALALFSLILVGLTYVQLRAARMHVSVDLFAIASSTGAMNIVMSVLSIGQGVLAAGAIYLMHRKESNEYFLSSRKR